MNAINSNHNKIKTSEFALAGLLHDVGKLLHRAKIDLLSKETIQEKLCPPNHSHRHVLWTYDLLKHLQDEYKLPKGIDWSRVCNLASYHHNPGNDPEYQIIATADRLASAHERIKADEEYHNFRQVFLENILSKVDIHKTISRLSSEEYQSQQQIPQTNRVKIGWYPQLLSVNEKLMPAEINTLTEDECVQNYWKPLAEGLKESLSRITNIPVNLIVAVVQSICAQYLSFMPESAMDKPDVSLFDHSKLTAAFAAAIANYYYKGGGSFTVESVRDSKEKKFRLVVGNIGGIQDFIFTQAAGVTGGFAKRYRAKSFYISAITEAAALYLLESAGLPLTNCIIDAGGRFTLLVDASQATLDALRKAEAEIQKQLVEKNLGLLKLYLNYDLTASGEDFEKTEESKKGNFSKLYKHLENQSIIAKLRPLEKYLKEQSKWNEAIYKMDFCDNYDKRLSEIDNNMKRIGQRLPQAAYYALTKPDNGINDNLSSNNCIDCLGLKLCLWNEKELEKAISNEKVHIAIVSLWQILPRPDDHGNHETDTSSWIPKRVIANYVPVANEKDIEHLENLTSKGSETARKILSPPQKDVESTRVGEDEEPPKVGDVMNFSHIAVHTQKIHNNRIIGQPMLACLKADVDWLGAIFSKGFSEKDVSLGRIATLSRLLDLFFKGYLSYKLFSADNVLPDNKSSNAVNNPGDNADIFQTLESSLQEMRDQYRLIYTVFSGGDDLFLIGSWDVICYLAWDIHCWLTQYVSGQPVNISKVIAHLQQQGNTNEIANKPNIAPITISAGIAFNHPKIPPSLLAKSAEEQLHIAKSSGEGGKTKNRIALLTDLMKGGMDFLKAESTSEVKDDNRINAALSWDEFACGLVFGKWLEEMLLRPSDDTIINRSLVYRLLQYACSAEFVRRLSQQEDRGKIPIDKITWRSRLKYDLARNVKNWHEPERLEKPSQVQDIHRLRRITGFCINQSYRPLILATVWALYKTRGGAL